jgi:hypothetical protein
MFVIFIKKAKTLRRPEPLGPLLYGVAHWVANRTRPRRRTKDLPADQAGPRLACQVEHNEQLDLLHDEIQWLPENYRMPEEKIDRLINSLSTKTDP